MIHTIIKRFKPVVLTIGSTRLFDQDSRDITSTELRAAIELDACNSFVKIDKKVVLPENVNPRSVMQRIRSCIPKGSPYRNHPYFLKMQQRPLWPSRSDFRDFYKRKSKSQSTCKTGGKFLLKNVTLWE